MKTFRTELLILAIALLGACGDTMPGTESQTAIGTEESIPPAADEPDIQPEISCQEQRQAFLAMSDAELFQRALDGEVGNCRIRGPLYDPVCNGYVIVSKAEWPRQGWPLNPITQDSTGCVTRLEDTCWGGYTSDMCTPDVTHNGSAQLRNALQNLNDVCGICNPDRTITVEMILGTPSVPPQPDPID